MIEEDFGVKILHTLKSFNERSVTPFINDYLTGVSISSIQELIESKEARARHLHLYAPAFKKDELMQMLQEVSTVSFNSLSQWNSFHSLTSDSSMGLRINPKLHLPIPSYCNPNFSYSRLGVDYLEFLERYERDSKEFKNLEGLHFHALFQSSSEGTSILLDHIVMHFKSVLPQLKWLNLGGGHNFTDDGFNLKDFQKTIERFKLLYPHIELYFEPGESVVKRCGDFVTTVLDIISIAGQQVVILDTSVETHLLDVAIVNLRLKVKGTQSASTPYFYELTGNTCLQGDLIGEYFFEQELQVGDEVIFEDMMGYSMVKMTEFNGMKRAGFYCGGVRSQIKK